MDRWCTDCRAPITESGRDFCDQCREGRQKIVAMMIRDPAAQKAQKAQMELNEVNARLGGMVCHKCGARENPFGIAAQHWYSRETCPKCSDEAFKKSAEDSKVRDAANRLRAPKGEE